MTLIEILIVLAIIGLISGTIAVAAVKYFEGARKKATVISARALHGIVETWRIDHAGECPTVPGLVADETMSEVSKGTDGWDHAFQIRCESVSRARIVSFGPDGKADTDDDIQMPEKR